MHSEPPFMAWIDELPELGDPIRRERETLHQLAKEAATLERHATTLRHQLAGGQRALLLKVMKHWTLADIQTASEVADSRHPMAGARASVRDPELRKLLHSLDGWHLASEALLVFHDAAVVGRQDLVSTGCEEDCRQALSRVLDWWNLIARPVCERLKGWPVASDGGRDAR